MLHKILSNGKHMGFNAIVLEDECYSSTKKAGIPSKSAERKRNIKVRSTFPLYGITYLSKANTHISTKKQNIVNMSFIMRCSQSIADFWVELNVNGVYEEKCMLFFKLPLKC